MTLTSPSIQRPVRPENPRRYWRSLCWVTPRIAICGDLPTDRDEAREQLRDWEENGITHEIDVRIEANDAGFVAANSGIEYVWHGVDDDGGRRDDSWFDEVTGIITGILASDPEAKVVVHCHLGVNRAPAIGRSSRMRRSASRSSQPMARSVANTIDGALLTPR